MASRLRCSAAAGTSNTWPAARLPDVTEATTWTSRVVRPRHGQGGRGCTRASGPTSPALAALRARSTDGCSHAPRSSEPSATRPGDQASPSACTDRRVPVRAPLGRPGSELDRFLRACRRSRDRGQGRLRAGDVTGRASSTGAWQEQPHILRRGIEAKFLSLFFSAPTAPTRYDRRARIMKAPPSSTLPSPPAFSPPPPPGPPQRRDHHRTSPHRPESARQDKVEFSRRYQDTHFVEPSRVRVKLNKATPDSGRTRVESGFRPDQTVRNAKIHRGGAISSLVTAKIFSTSRLASSRRHGTSTLRATHLLARPRKRKRIAKPSRRKLGQDAANAPTRPRERT